jgi:acyl carrier protein
MNSTTTEIAPRVRAFLQRSIGSRVLQDDDDIFAGGFVNSLMAIQLVAFLEKEFSFTIGDADLNLQNFSSVNRITAFVTKKLG